MSYPWWIKFDGRELAQGDLLEGCLMPVFAGVRPDALGSDMIFEVNVAPSRLIVITQSCDLVHDGKIEFVALCPIYRLNEFEKENPEFSKKGMWDNVRKGKNVNLHLLADTDTPLQNKRAFVVDFGQIVSLPIGYLRDHAESLGDRWRLGSPYLEHFSQAFARFFMRVGLPSDIPPYK